MVRAGHANLRASTDPGQSYGSCGARHPKHGIPRGVDPYISHPGGRHHRQQWECAMGDGAGPYVPDLEY